MSIRHTVPGSPALAVVGALVIVLVGLAFRVSGLDWDRRRLMHPDERFLVMTTATLSLPSSVGEYLDGERSPLNPRQPGRAFAYGTWPLSLTRAALATREEVTLADIVLTGRRLSVVADMCTLLVLGWLARRMCGVATTLLAMAFYACAVLPIQHSHFFVVDPWLTLWSTVSIAGLAEWHQRPGRLPAAVAGMGTALAVACKVSGVLLLAPAAVLLAWQVAGARLTASARTPWRTVVGCALTYTGVGLVVIRVAAPDMFAGGWMPWPDDRWLADMRQVAHLSSGSDDAPPAFQWAHRTPLLFAWWNLVRYGLGPGLGLTATVAGLVALWRALGHWQSRVFMPAVWTAVLVVVVGTSFVSAMRYLLPAYPVLCLLAAWWLVQWRERLGTSAHAWVRPAVTCLTILVAASTAIWALAFTSIYRDLHPRLAASRWIFDNIPAGAVLTAEAWDDALPYSASRQTHASRYTILTLPVTDEDSPAKVEALVEGLDRADYVVLSSARIAETIVRLPHRFPVMVRYYEALTNGTLGFDRVVEFTSFPRLGPWVWPDTAAEEAFTVYDHPRVRIFRKRQDWSPDEARSVLGSVDWQTIVRTTTRQASMAPGLLQLPDSRFDRLRTEGTWRRGAGDGGRFGPPLTAVAAASRWLVLVLAVTVLAWPACAAVLPHTWGRGLLVAPALGVLWIGWVTWVWGSVSPWPLTYLGLTAALGSLGILSTMLAWPGRRELRDWFVTHRRLVAVQVGALVAVGCVGVALRAANPDLWHPVLGGEKPMDIAILSALVRADGFPAFDPWFAGGVLNYYYFGFVPVALLCRLTGVEPAQAYTLAVGTWWALTAGGVAIVAATLVERLGLSARPGLAGTFAAVLAVGSGNLRQIELAWQWLRDEVPARAWYWHASRAIPVPEGEIPPVTEFPFFTYLFADLHAHLLAMPWLLAVVLASLQIVDGRSRSGVTPALILGGLLVGVLVATNAWDVPIAVALLAGATAVRHGFHTAPSERSRAIRRWLVQLALLAVIATGASWPLWAHYAAPAGGVAPWRGARSPWWALLLIHGPFLLVLIPALIAVAGTWRRQLVRTPPTLVWTGALATLGLLIVCVVEVVVVRGDVGRMNTVFKSYLQVWLLWSALVPAAWLLTRNWLGDRYPHASWPRRAFTAVTGLTGALMLMYPLTATWPRLTDRMAPDAPRGLDGTTFMAHARLTTPSGTFSLDEDRQVIRWLLDHVVGTPTIIEAQTDQYQWGGRISAHTGLPTVLGWTWHARQQRMALPSSLVGRRRRDVRVFYTTSSADEAWDVARRHDIRYVVVGALERQLYPADGLDKFDADARWTVVFSTGATRVYARGA